MQSLVCLANCGKHLIIMLHFKPGSNKVLLGSMMTGPLFSPVIVWLWGAVMSKREQRGRKEGESGERLSGRWRHGAERGRAGW